MKTSLMLLLSAALAAAAVTAQNGAAHEFSKCKNQHEDPMGVSSLVFLPDPPVSGRPVKVAIKGTPSVDVTEGQIHIDVRVLGITVNSQVLNVCDIVACPIKANQEFSGEMSQDIPEGTPDHMGATVRLSLVANGKTITCLESFVQINSSPSKEQGLLLENAAEQPKKKGELLLKEIEFLFNKWRAQHPKMAANLKTFTDNLKKIMEHNAQKDKTFTMAMNEFGSMTTEEFAASRLGVREPKQDVERNGPMKPRVTLLRQEVSKADPPSEMDWTTKGVVSQVKNQGSCGSCWAFSAVGSLESAYAIKTGQLIEFSEQELVSCDDNDYGCQGGLMDSAFDWIERSSSGLCSETDYPYTSGFSSARGECMQSTCTPVPNSVPKGYVDIPPNEAALLAAVAQHGPVSVAIEADQAAFQFYHGGVLTAACGNHLNHGVLLVGYGVDGPTGTPFWKVKNSWGPGYGEAGYIRLMRGKRWPNQGGECGINLKASYPVFD